MAIPFSIALPFSPAAARARGDRPALRLGPGPDDPALSYRDLADAVARRVGELRRTIAASGGVVAVETTSPALQLIDLLAALELAVRSASAGAGPDIEVLATNAGWWPRERDAVFERLRPAWRVHSRDLAGAPTVAAVPPPPHHVAPQAGPGGRPAPYQSVLHREVSTRPDDAERQGTTLWLASVGSFGEPTAYGFGPAQIGRWGAPTGPRRDEQHGGRVVVTGEVGHAPTLRAALAALARGAELHLTGRAQLAAVLAHRPSDELITTPLLLRRALRQLRRREHAIGAVHHTTLHQGDVRPHEKLAWPDLLGGTVTASISATEAGGWLLHDGVAADGIDVAVHDEHTLHGTDTLHGADGPQGAGAVHLGGAGAALRDAGGTRPPSGWASGDLARRDHGVLHWLGRRRDRFVVDGHGVDPVAVEAVLGAHELVADVVVAPRPHPERGNVVVAVIVPSNPAWPPFLDDLAERCAQLPAWARPEALAIVEDIPVNAAGAVHRRLVNFEEAGR